MQFPYGLMRSPYQQGEHVNGTADGSTNDQDSSELPYEDDAIPHHHPPAVPG